MKCRSVLGLFFVLVGVLFAVVVEAQEKLEKIYVGVAGLSGALAHAFIPKDSGLYEKHGLDVELIFFQGGTQAIQATLAGGVQVVVTAGPEIIGGAARRFGYDHDRGLYEYASLQHRCGQKYHPL